MHANYRWLAATALLGSALLLPRCHDHPTPAAAPHTHDPHAHHEPAAARPVRGTNAVQNEMIYLQEAMQKILLLVSNNRLAEIPAALEPVHEARALTEKSIAAKEYRAPKNPGQMDEFVRLDGAFHAELEKLLEAAGRNDLEGASRQYGTVVQTCTVCHQQFRFP